MLAAAAILKESATPTSENEVEARDERTDDGAGRVDGVEQANLAAHPLFAGDGGLADERQGGAHQRRRHDQHQECDDEADDGERKERIGELGVHRHPDSRQRLEHERCGERRDADQRLGDAEGHQRASEARGHTSADELPTPRPAMKPASTVLAA
jgi:hypothetical protein